MKEKIDIFYSKDWVDYELLDTGEGEKLERVGKYKFIRPYEDAVWARTLSKKEWSDVNGKFWSSKAGAKSGWKMNKEIEKKWQISYKGINLLVMPTPFRHYGFFPEQASHWDFIEGIIAQQNKIFSSCALPGVPGGTLGDKKFHSASPKKRVKFLNLFGYTGIASLFALRAGAEVTHLDASKQSLAWAKENQKISGLENLPMRVICDDALKFIEREAKRGNRYDCIIMDPPKYGRGPKGEIWKIEDKLPELLAGIKKILSAKPLFVILTSYAIDTSSISLGYALEETMKEFSGEVKNGELCVLEKTNARIIPLANTVVWESK